MRGKRWIDTQALCGYDVITMYRARTRLVRIGNSQGFRIPKAALADLPADADYELTVTGDQITVRPLETIIPRERWGAFIDAADAQADADAFADMEATAADGLDDEPPLPVVTG